MLSVYRLMDTDLAHQAIQAAIKGAWKIAENLNRKILTNEPNNIEAMLRLANAAAQLGKLKETKTNYEKILKLDPRNPFAERGLARLKNLKRGEKVQDTHSLTNSFLEEPGKTKTVTLVYTAGGKVVATLDTGEPVQLLPRRRRISVVTLHGVYVGRVPDDLSVRLLGLIKGGNRYEATIKATGPDSIKVFIREIYRSQKFLYTPSFPTEDFSSVNNHSDH